MSWTYDPTTDAGKVRLLCTDTNNAVQIFTDDEITAFLEIASGSIRLAAAAALDTIATQQALLLKVLVFLDMETDGAKVADALRKQAMSLREQEAADTSFDIAEVVYDTFSARDRIYKQALRGVF